MNFFKVVVFNIFICLSFFSISSYAEVVGEVSTTWRIMGDDRIVVESVNDEGISGVTCHISYAKSGGIAGNFGLADDPSRFSIACRQTGPLIAKSVLPKQVEVAGFRRSAIFKEMKVVRMMDIKNNVIIYLVYATRLIDGSPFNSISSVPLMPWGVVMPQVTVK